MARKQELPAAVCREVFPHDPDFPQLATATDPGLMLEQFRTHLRPATGTVYHIEDCVPFRFRCRQSTSRCVLQYTLRIVDPRTGDRQDLWVTGLVYARPGAAERLWHDMQAADPRREIPEPWRTFEPVGFIPDLQMAVQVFPYDRKLPNLSLVLSGAWPGLDRLLLARREAGRWHAEGQSIEPTRYRTELGAALKYTTHARDALTRRLETLHCYLKVYRNERGEQTDRLLRALAEADGRKPYGVVCPLAYLSELRTLVLEEAPGVALQHVLLQGDAAAGIDAVARAVAAFNQDDIPIAHCPPHSLADQLDDVKRAASLVQWAWPPARRPATPSQGGPRGEDDRTGLRPVAVDHRRRGARLSRPRSARERSAARRSSRAARSARRGGRHRVVLVWRGRGDRAIAGRRHPGPRASRGLHGRRQRVRRRKTQ